MTARTAGPRVPPHDEDAERSMLGAMMLSADGLEDGALACTPEDFYRPAHGALFASLKAMYERGEPCDAVTVAAELGRQGWLERVGGIVGLMDMQVETPTSNAARYATIIARHALSRRLIAEAAELAEAAYSGEYDPSDLLDRTQARLGGFHAPKGRAPANLTTWDAFWDRPVDTYKPWAIPGLLRVGWRAIIVAAEGSGKSICSSQIALCAGQGIHPFTFDPIEPITTLFVDLENPDEHIDLRGRMMRQPLMRSANGMYQADRTWLWHQPGGMNIRTRPGRAGLEAAISEVRPQLVVIAPVYKMFRTKPGETDEMAAGDVQNILDDLRTRYGFALLMEHHAPKGVTKARDMVPFGSSLWLRWPEIGKALLPAENPGDLIVDVFRADRMPCSWPDRLDRGTHMPWQGYYKGGIAATRQIENQPF